ncbi:MAG: helix-turn-helix transcriptional regulator [Gemmatimonadaceae bacterium]|jgi:DNA-binding CsgD family transcriptional regulator|nr:helix-turn-helix transcriptional regulator [Gemmatimonadaceae bacterium]
MTADEVPDGPEAPASTGDDQVPTPRETVRLQALAAVVLVFVAIGGVVDLLLDRPTRWWSAHVIIEVSVLIASLTLALLVAREWWRTTRALAVSRADLVATRQSLEERRRERDAWRASAEAVSRRVVAAVDGQFDRWHLTPTEREVALLLLAGVGHKQIAAQTGRSERTVRQHAIRVYEKSGQGGRAELAAFFLRGLLPPEGSGSLRESGQPDEAS